MKCSWLTTLIAVAALSGAVSGAAAAGPEQQTPQAGQTFRDCPDCPEMVAIPAGNFLMGSSNEETARDVEAVLPNNERRYAQGRMTLEHPQHLVHIDRSFALGKYRVTRSEFAAFVRETGYLINGGCTLWIDHKYPVRPEAKWQNPGFTQTDRDPVVCVNRLDVKAYIAWLNGKLRDHTQGEDDGPYRLPSEAEWEYAARAGTRTARWWGDSIGSDNANCDGCGSAWDKKETAPAGSFQTNPFGLSDVLGNAWEETEDCWNETHAGAPEDGSVRATGMCERRVMKGGSWTNHPWVLRSAVRSHEDPNLRTNFIGFRVARTLP